MILYVCARLGQSRERRKREKIDGEHGEKEREREGEKKEGASMCGHWYWVPRGFLLACSRAGKYIQGTNPAYRSVSTWLGRVDIHLMIGKRRG